MEYTLSKANLLKGRRTYRPFSYEQAYKFWEQQQNAHWIATSVAMGGDVQDWKETMSEDDKAVLSNILKGFIQTEVVVNDYWSQNVSKWFPHPEIAMMCAAFASMESIHTHGYAYLNDTLGIEDYNAFLEEPTAKAKIDRLDELLSVIDSNDVGQIARSLAIFSAFTEGVSLFSSFAFLLNFSRFNRMKGLGQIISYSIKDEALHSEAGCWLFRTLVEENPHIWTDDLKKDIYEAARITVALEDAFIDKAFENREVEGLTPHDLKMFIRNRANSKLGELGLKTNWKNIDQDALERMSWFDSFSIGTGIQDFFAGHETNYSKVGDDFYDMW